MGAAVSCATVNANELLIGTQEGELVGFALDPGALYHAPVRDVAAWARTPQRQREVVRSPLGGAG